MKNNTFITLENAQYYKPCFIKGFTPCTKLKTNKLYDIGIIENSEITPLYSSIFKGTKAYLVKGSVIALRNSDTKEIIVSQSV